jgi:epsilon-lactone hydrolase
VNDLDDLMVYLRNMPPQAGIPLEQRRRHYDRAEKAYPVAPDVRVEPLSVAGLHGEMMHVGVDTGRCLLYLHGGGFVMGSSRSHRHLAAALARQAGCSVLSLDYALAPEHPFPAALEDATRAYGYLLAQYGAQNLAIAGDSAGGGLALSTLVASREKGLAMPAAAVCLSPWADLDVAHRPERCAGDPLVDRSALSRDAAACLAGTRPDVPLASPLHADLRDFPPLLIEAGADEYLADDSRRLARRAAEAGVDVHLELVPGVPHVWHWFWPRLKLGQDGVQRAGDFIKARFGRP